MFSNSFVLFLEFYLQSCLLIGVFIERTLLEFIRYLFIQYSYNIYLYDIRCLLFLKVLSCKLYNKKHMIALTQVTNTEIFALISVVVLQLLSCKVLFTNEKR